MGFVIIALATGGGSGQDDRDLARRIKRGETEAFRAFFDRYHGLLFGFLRRRGHSPDICEDLVQQAFVTIWERREQIDEEKSLRSFLFKIGHNRALNHVRDTARFIGAEALSETPDPSSPEEHTEHALMVDRLRTVVDQLPERRRAVFELCFLNGFTYREAAEALEISARTVEHQMAAALKVLRHAFESYT